MGNRDSRDNHDEVGRVEGRHGDKTHGAFIESQHGRHGGSEESEGAPQDAQQQHDEAEKNSESNRLRR